jgi:DNA-binding GntR family transcriptional regulator
MRSNYLEFITIDRRSTVSYDNQIKERIKSLILDQTFYYQTQLPNLNDIAAVLKIDLKLVKKAFEDLELEHYIKKLEDGSYQVIYLELANYYFYRNIAIYDAIKALGMTPSIVCLKKEVLKLKPDQLIDMGFSKHETILYIQRVYQGNQRPIMVLENYLPLSIFTHMDTLFQGDEPLNEFIKTHYQITAKLSHRMTKAVNLSIDLSNILGERKHAASIQSTNKVYDQLNRLIDYGQSHATSNYYFQALITKDEMKRYYTQMMSETV